MHIGSERESSSEITKKHVYMPQRAAITDAALVHGSYLVLLGKPEAVVGLESLYVVGQVNDWNGRVLPHSWERRGGGRKGERVRPGCS